MENVTVLMSTYNGEKYLREQIDSILAQEKIKVNLIVRDDGSSDGTISILEEYKAKGELSYYCGQNIGPARSFLQMLNTAPESDYYAFSDQDDYWLPDKLATAVNMLRAYKDRPCLYFCQTQLADKDLNKTDSVIIKPLLTFGESLVYQFVGGCTMVMNSKLKDTITKYSPEYLPMHDVWVYDIALATGAYVVFDPTPHILYRQHGNNAIGQSHGNWRKEWKKRWQRVAKNKEHSRYKTALELRKGYWDVMEAENKAILGKFIEGHNAMQERLSMLYDPRYQCSNRKVHRMFQAALLLNTY